MINLRKQNARPSTPTSGEMMKWICLDCHRTGRPAKFLLPKGPYPKGGCPMCGSHQILDINVQSIAPGLVGDPLDLSLAEISQAVNHHANVISDAVQIIKDDCPEGGTPNDLAWACEEVAACDKLFRENDDLMQIAEGRDGLVDVINILWHRLQEAEGMLSPMGQQISALQKKQNKNAVGISAGEDNR